MQRHATQRPQLSGREIIYRSSVKMSKQAVHNARARQMKKTNGITNFQTLITLKDYHLLTSEGEEKPFFGSKEALCYMASTNFMFADGSFKCVPPAYSQLCIFHTHVANNVSFPQLFCLVKWKNGDFYTRLLLLVEGLAAANGMTFFNRRMTLMCDFESSFINAVHQLFHSVIVKCCLFHYTKNLRVKATPIINNIKRQTGNMSETHFVAEKTKRRFMMLPLIPVELVTSEVVARILLARSDHCPNGHKDEFNEIAETLIRTYIGRPPTYPFPIDPRFPPSLWSVCGMSVRTNNSAESVHAQLNPKVGGKLSLVRFLCIIEGQIRRNRIRIHEGCKSESHAVQIEKNRLLGLE